MFFSSSSPSFSPPPSSTPARRYQRPYKVVSRTARKRRERAEDIRGQQDRSAGRIRHDEKRPQGCPHYEGNRKESHRGRVQMQVHVVQCAHAGGPEDGLRLGHADGPAEEDEADGQEETGVLRLQPHLIHVDDHI